VSGEPVKVFAGPSAITALSGLRTGTAYTAGPIPAAKHLGVRESVSIEVDE